MPVIKVTELFCARVYNDNRSEGMRTAREERGDVKIKMRYGIPEGS